MAGRGPQTFKKRQKEQARKEKHDAKIEKRLQRRREGPQEVDEFGEPIVRPTENVEEGVLESPPTTDSSLATDSPLPR